jgi:hypothetical protein
MTGAVEQAGTNRGGALGAVLLGATLVVTSCAPDGSVDPPAQDALEEDRLACLAVQGVAGKAAATQSCKK